MGVGGLLAAAIHDNAEWCDLVCRRAGLSPTFDEHRWWCAERTPPLHPDAITLRPGLDAAAVLAGVDTSAGCSVKDCFADLTLPGFAVLFEATWFAIVGGGDEPWFDGAGDLHRGCGDVVGIVNVVNAAGWRACLAAAGAGSTVVGYSRIVPDGATALGPMRVLVAR